MGNLWLIFNIIIICSIGSVIIGVTLFVKKEKYYIISCIILVALNIFIYIADRSYIKDLIKQETTQIEVKYVEYQSGSSNTHPGTRKLFFSDINGDIIELIGPVIKKYHVKMEEGKTYLVEYFNNTKVIKTYTLIE